MIKKLRKKFMFVNMIFVVTILAATLGILFVSYRRKAILNTSFFMENDLNRNMGEGSFTGFHVGKQGGGGSSGEVKPEDPEGGSPDDPGAPQKDSSQKETAGFDLFSVFSGGSKKNQGPGNFLPSVIFKVDADGKVLQKTERELTVDDTTAPTLISEALTKKDAGGHGYIADYGLTYLVKTSATDGNSYIILADNSYERDSIRNFFISCILIFVIAFFLFLILSYFLSRWALTPVEKAWKQQNQFVADASHELKTPITVILANLDILSAHKEDTISRQFRWVENTKDEAERMKQLIQDLLFLAKSDANALPVVMSEVNFSDLSFDRALSFESVAFEKKVELNYDGIEPGLSVSGNEGQLKQLLSILLDNAIKYAGLNGKVVMKVGKESEKVKVSVNNTGETIDENEIGHIFERFYRTDKSRARSVGGYGLGLSIADNIVKLHHGTIVCTSTAENGTTFTVELPTVTAK